ncbi:Slam-dependent surface lipoprotein [Neisseria shayeganii]|uniref:Transferrin-binding protein-like solute binding protein n=1 Tax=Neisseria shayeganii TaxID=607712 RepID=A0A7D7T5S3_9NEIS|nr:Slam-dependent surface lipoprotein [Neisseria shayeganii]QMT41033.1 transferrin-binding protein-like solute binding protein [Neisseria shayeganii]
MKISAFGFSVFSSALLAACAGGSSVPIPDGPVQIPQLKTSPESTIIGPAKAPIQAMHTGAGKLEAGQVQITYSWGYTTTEDRFFYRSSDGKLYQFGRMSNPLLLSGSFAPDTNTPTRQKGQPTDNGGQLLVCCDGVSATIKPGYTRAMRYGAWIGADGKTDLFVGGVPADPAHMLGVQDSQNQQATGKATYEVLAMRVKGSDVVLSSHDNNSPTLRSRLTVNFNTQQMGGKILGNNDFGADIDFTDVRVNGNTFSGSATSGGEAGKVEGGFYGSKGYYTPSGTEIGGKITFDGNRSLDSVFGGSSYRSDAKDGSTDLVPLP